MTDRPLLEVAIYDEPDPLLPSVHRIRSTRQRRGFKNLRLSSRGFFALGDLSVVVTLAQREWRPFFTKSSQAGFGEGLE